MNENLISISKYINPENSIYFQLLQYHNDHNFIKFKQILHQNKNIISQDELTHLFKMCLNSYCSIKNSKGGNNNINYTKTPNKKFDIPINKNDNDIQLINEIAYLSLLINSSVNLNMNILEKNFNDDNNNNNKIFNENLKTPLMLFCEFSDINMIDKLIENKKVDLNVKDEYGRNALYYLKGGVNDSKIIDRLIANGIDKNNRDYDGNTPLHYYILMMESKEKIILSLIENKCDLNIINGKGISALQMIIEKIIMNNINNNKNNNDVKKIFSMINESLNFSTFYEDENNINKKNNNNNEDNEDNNENNEDNNNNPIDYKEFITNEKIMIKLPLNNNSNISMNNKNCYIKLKPIPTLIINSKFDFKNDDKFSIKNKIEILKELNKRKKDLINLLKNSKNKIKNNTEKIKQEIQTKIINNRKIKQILNELEIKQNQIKNNQNSTKLKNLIKEFNDRVSRNKTLSNYLIEKYNPYFIINNNTNSNNNNSNIITNNYLINKFKDFYCNTVFSAEYIVNELKKDLLDFQDYVHFNVNQLSNTLLNLTNLLTNFVADSLGPNYNIKVYGSRATKLCLPWSDIDLVISCSNFVDYSPLNTLYQYILQKKDFYENIKYINNTAIPLIKIITTSDFNNVSVDISLEDSKHYGVECVNYIKNLIKENEVLSPMCLAVKNILQKANLNDPYKGGLSSYGVILLIMNYLNIEKENKFIEINLNNLGWLFYHFLEFYGGKFQPQNNGIIDVNNSNDPSLFNQYQFKIINNELVIVDPLNRNNNVGKNTRQFCKIQQAFLLAFNCLRESCECGCHFQYENFNIRENGIEHNFLKRIFNCVKRVNNNE